MARIAALSEPTERVGQGLDEAALSELDRRFETFTPARIVRWAVNTFGPRICLTASMADAVLIDIATSVDRRIEIVFLDTGYHFPETLDTLDRVRSRYELNVRVMRTTLARDSRWETDVDGCCAARKVAQLEKALVGKDAWMSDIRRSESRTRRGARIVARDSRGLVKVNPLATWGDDEVASYIAEHDVIVNPLVSNGFPSLGCWPCTRRVADGEDTRAGRWQGTDKLECGLHS